jgi:cell filamentation protein
MDSVYCYQGTDVLKNKFNIKDESLLNIKERQVTAIRIIELIKDPIPGKFDFKHLLNTHNYIFQDLYSWAGKVRTVDISKGVCFCPTQYISNEADRIFNGIKKENYLKGLNIDKFSDRLAYYSGEINALHPFREGNGRSTREFIRSLAQEAGYTITYSDINKDKLFLAFVKSFTDHTELKNVFKSNTVNNIKELYKDEFKTIKYASESLLDKLQELKMVLQNEEYISIKTIKDSYIELCNKVDNGLLDNSDPTFKLIYDIKQEIGLLSLYNQKENFNINKSIINNKNIDIEL